MQTTLLINLISGESPYTSPEKLQSIKDLPIPIMPEEVRQILDLTGCNCKFIPDYMDLLQSLRQLTRKVVPVYQDPNQLYTLFTDPFHCAWSG